MPGGRGSVSESFANNVLVFDPPSSSSDAPIGGALEPEEDGPDGSGDLPSSSSSSSSQRAPSPTSPAAAAAAGEGVLVQWAENEWGQQPSAARPEPEEPQSSRVAEKPKGSGFLGWLFSGGASQSPPSSLPTDSSASQQPPPPPAKGARRSDKRSVALAVSELMDEASGKLPVNVVDALGVPALEGEDQAGLGRIPPRPLGPAPTSPPPSDAGVRRGAANFPESKVSSLSSAAAGPHKSSTAVEPSAAAIFTWLQIVGGGSGGKDLGSSSSTDDKS